MAKFFSNNPTGQVVLTDSDVGALAIILWRKCKRSRSVAKLFSHDPTDYVVLNSSNAESSATTS